MTKPHGWIYTTLRDVTQANRTLTSKRISFRGLSAGKRHRRLRLVGREGVGRRPTASFESSIRLVQLGAQNGNDARRRHCTYTDADAACDLSGRALREFGDLDCKGVNA
jgi:hypothetical protein